MYCMCEWRFYPTSPMFYYKISHLITERARKLLWLHDPTKRDNCMCTDVYCMGLTPFTPHVQGLTHVLSGNDCLCAMLSMN